MTDTVTLPASYPSSFREYVTGREWLRKRTLLLIAFSVIAVVLGDPVPQVALLLWVAYYAGHYSNYRMYYGMPDRTVNDVVLATPVESPNVSVRGSFGSYEYEPRTSDREWPVPVVTVETQEEASIRTGKSDDMFIPPTNSELYVNSGNGWQLASKAESEALGAALDAACAEWDKEKPEKEEDLFPFRPYNSLDREVSGKDYADFGYVSNKGWDKVVSRNVKFPFAADAPKVYEAPDLTSCGFGVPMSSGITVEAQRKLLEEVGSDVPVDNLTSVNDDYVFGPDVGVNASDYRSDYFDLHDNVKKPDSVTLNVAGGCSCGWFECPYREVAQVGGSEPLARVMAWAEAQNLSDLPDAEEVEDDEDSIILGYLGRRAEERREALQAAAKAGEVVIIDTDGDPKIHSYSAPVFDAMDAEIAEARRVSEKKAKLREMIAEEEGDKVIVSLGYPRDLRIMVRKPEKAPEVTGPRPSGVKTALFDPALEAFMGKRWVSQALPSSGSTGFEFKPTPKDIVKGQDVVVPSRGFLTPAPTPTPTPTLPAKGLDVVVPARGTVERQELVDRLREKYKPNVKATFADIVGTDPKEALLKTMRATLGDVLLAIEEQPATQRDDVLALLQGGKWWTLEALANKSGFGEASVSARLRDLRKAAYGSHTIERKSLGDGSRRFRYRLVK